MDLHLTGKIAMVGGASKGLGFAVARALAIEGAHVSIASRGRDAVAAAGEKIQKESGVAVVAHAADLSDADAIGGWYKETVDRFGGVDLLFTNTGGPPAGAALAFDDQGWRSAFDLLVLSAIRTVRLVVPTMQRKRRGQRTHFARTIERNERMHVEIE